MWWIALTRKRQHPQQESFSFRCFGPVLCSSLNVCLVVHIFPCFPWKEICGDQYLCSQMFCPSLANKCCYHLKVIMIWVFILYIIIEYMGWECGTLPFFYQRTRRRAQSPATCHFATQSLIQNPQKYIDVCSLISVDLNTFLSLRLPLLRVAWPSNLSGGLHGTILCCQK